MNTAFFYTGLIILLLSAIYLYIMYKKNKFRKFLKKKIDDDWGKEAGNKYAPGDLSSIAGYFKNTKSEAFHIDDITWNDLDMDSIFKKFNRTHTSMGEEYLYSMLRVPLLSVSELEEREKLIDFFAKAPTDRKKMQFVLAHMEKKRGVELSDYFTGENKALCIDSLKRNLYRIIPVINLFFLVCMAINFYAFLTLFIISMITTTTIYYKTKGELEHRLEAISFISQFIIAASRLAALDVKQMGALNKRLLEGLPKIKHITKYSSWLYTDSVNPLLEYIKILMLAEVNSFNRIMVTLSEQKAVIRDIYEVIGTIDACISIASVRAGINGKYDKEQAAHWSGWTRPVFMKENRISAKNIYHPLISDAVTNTLDTEKNVLLTGSNASGKSTFLKTIAVNAILAQTVATCFAQNFSIPLLRTYTSMALRDNIYEGESYYIVEIRSLKRIIDALNGEIPVLCVIDEVLRGTNTIDRISASSQVLSYLGSKCLCFAATHDLELTHMLGKSFQNFHFSEKVENKNVLFDYKLKEGASGTRNALLLLEAAGYPEEITAGAYSLACELAEKGILKTA